MKLLDSFSGDSLDDRERMEWENATGRPVMDDTLMAGSPCGCRFTLQAVGFDFVWTPCQRHFDPDPSEEPASATEFPGMEKWRRFVAHWANPQAAMHDLTRWYLLFYGFAAKDILTLMQHNAADAMHEERPLDDPKDSP